MSCFFQAAACLRPACRLIIRKDADGVNADVGKLEHFQHAGSRSSKSNAIIAESLSTPSVSWVRFFSQSKSIEQLRKASIWIALLGISRNAGREGSRWQPRNAASALGTHRKRSPVSRPHLGRNAGRFRCSRDGVVADLSFISLCRAPGSAIRNGAAYLDTFASHASAPHLIMERNQLLDGVRSIDRRVGVANDGRHPIGRGTRPVPEAQCNGRLANDPESPKDLQRESFRLA